jgi:nucleoside 2-deoxyribosyltransferase
MIPNRPNVYVAGPLFSLSERQWNASLKATLGKVSDVYLPQEDGQLLVELVSSGIPILEAKASIFKCDLEAIEKCHVIILLMDGRVLDEGACFEVGYAFARGKVCVGFKTDVRSLLPIGDNPMIECALRHIFSNPSQIVQWLDGRNWLKD